jgi:hypothetical protein
MFSNFFQWLKLRRAEPKQASSSKTDVKDMALKQLRETRAGLMERHSEVLERIKAQYEQSEKPQESQDNDEEYVRIDRTKNMEAILQFMQISKSPTMREKLREAVKDKLQ